MYTHAFLFWDKKRSESETVLVKESGEETTIKMGFVYAWSDVVQALMSEAKAHGLKIVDQSDLFEDRFEKSQTLWLG